MAGAQKWGFWLKPHDFYMPGFGEVLSPIKTCWSQTWACHHCKVQCSDFLRKKRGPGTSQGSSFTILCLCPSRPVVSPLQTSLKKAWEIHTLHSPQGLCNNWTCRRCSALRKQQVHHLYNKCRDLVPFLRCLLGDYGVYELAFCICHAILETPMYTEKAANLTHGFGGFSPWLIGTTALRLWEISPSWWACMVQQTVYHMSGRHDSLEGHDFNEPGISY